MSELMRLIQSHLDRYGVTRATFAKRVGTTPQTVQNWKSRSTTMPRAEHLRGIAKETGIPYLIVLDAALMDAGYRDSLADDLESLKVRIARYVGKTEQGVADIEDYLNFRSFPSQADLDEAHSGMTQSEVDAFIDQLIANADQQKYGNDELFDREFLRQYVSDNAGESDELEDEPEPDASTEGRSTEEAASSSKQGDHVGDAVQGDLTAFDDGLEDKDHSA